MKTSELIKETHAEVHGALEVSAKNVEGLIDRIHSLQEEIKSLQEANLALRKSTLEFKNWSVDRIKALANEVDREVEADPAKARELARKVYEGR